MEKYKLIIPKNSPMFPSKAMAIGTASVASRYKLFLEKFFKDLVAKNFEVDWRGPVYEQTMAQLSALVRANAFFVEKRAEGMTADNLRLTFTGSTAKPAILAELAKGLYAFFEEHTQDLSDLAYLFETKTVDHSLK